MNNCTTLSNGIDNLAQRTYTLQEVGEIIGYMLNVQNYPGQPMNLDNGTAQVIRQPLATSKRMTLDVKEMASELRVSTQTIRKLIKDGELPAFKVGGKFVVSRKALEQWVMQKTQEQGGTCYEAC